MKKIFTISLLAVYLILTVGMNILIHTCGGESEAMLATTNSQDPCACGSEMPTDNCCKTELKSVQLNDVQTVPAANIEQNLVLIGILPMIEHSMFNVQYSTSNVYINTSPPNKDLQIANSVFLI